MTPIPNTPQFNTALWQLHRAQGGGYIKLEDVEALARTVRVLPRLPPLPRAVVIPPLPRVVILPPLPLEC